MFAISANNPDSDSDSGDDALLEMLGLPTLSLSTEIDTSAPSHSETSCVISPSLDPSSLLLEYESKGIVKLPLHVPRKLLNAATLQTTFSAHPLKTYETINSQKHLTRCEKFVDLKSSSDDTVPWSSIISSLEEISSAVLKKPQHIFKEKLNYKPPKGKGFAPHLDGPSLAMTGQGEEGE